MITADAVDRLLTDLAGEELFERPLGPSAVCFTTNQVVRMLESGASPDELRHLLSCQPCSHLVTRSGQLAGMLRSGASETSEAAAEGTPDRGGETSATGELTMLISLLDPVLHIENPNQTFSITVELVPSPVPGGGALDPESLRLDGAARSTQAQIHESPLSGSPQSRRVTFRHASLSKTIRKVLIEHSSVADEISISGTMLGHADRVFLGRARVEFAQADPLSRQAIL